MRRPAHLAGALGLATAVLGCGGPRPGSAAPGEQQFFRKGSAPLRPGAWFSGAPAAGGAAPASESLVLALEAAGTGDRVMGSAEVPADACVLFIARGSEGVTDVDLLVFSEEGELLASDEAPDPRPRVLLCPPHPGEFFAVARVAAGEGVVAIGAERVPPARSAAVARAYGITTAGASTPPGEAWAGLDDRINEHRRGLGGTWVEGRRSVVAVDARVPAVVTLTVEKGRCLSVVAVPSPELYLLDLVVRDASGRLIAQGGHGERTRWAVLCAGAEALVNVELRAFHGRGTVALSAARSEEGAATALGARATSVGLPPLAPLATELARTQAALGQAGYGRPSLSRAVTLSAAARVSTELEFSASSAGAPGPAGSASAGCQRIDVILGAPLRGVRAWLWTEDGALVAEGEGQGALALAACPAAGRHRLDLESLSVAGEVQVEVRAEPTPPPPLAAHPLAAARLLGRFRGLYPHLPARQLEEVRALPVDAASQARAEWLLPPQRCLEVGVGLGAGAAGLDVRVVEATGAGVELARDHGTVSGLTRACSTRGGKLRVEVSAAAGSGTALVGVRVVPMATP